MNVNQKRMGQCDHNMLVDQLSFGVQSHRMSLDFVPAYCSFISLAGTSLKKKKKMFLRRWWERGGSCQCAVAGINPTIINCFFHSICDTEEKYICIETFSADNADEISLEKGVVVEVLQKNMDGWWNVRLAYIHLLTYLRVCVCVRVYVCVCVCVCA